MESSVLIVVFSDNKTEKYMIVPSVRSPIYVYLGRSNFNCTHLLCSEFFIQVKHTLVEVGERDHKKMNYNIILHIYNYFN